MARNALYSPFAEQHSSSIREGALSGLPVSRASPFEHAAATPHGLEAQDLETGWMDSPYGPGLRQRYLDVFQPLGAASRSSSTGRRGRGARWDQDVQVLEDPCLTPVTQRVWQSDDISSSSSAAPYTARSTTGLNGNSSRLSSQVHPHPVRAHAFISPGAAVQEPRAHTMPPQQPHPQQHLGMLHAAASFGRPDSSSGSGSGGDGGRTGGISRNRTLRRLQRRSSSLFAATSATASNLWSSLSALGDRSRSLLCRNSPVLSDGLSRGGSTSSSSEGGSSGMGLGGSSGSNGVTLDGSSGGMAGNVLSSGGSSGGGGGMAFGVVGGPVLDVAVTPMSSRGPPVHRHPQRLLSRSIAIRRSASRSAAVLIDIDATDSYDDLLALDQFNVKRAVKTSVLASLPCRSPSTDDEQQQRQCHICLQPWVPVKDADISSRAPAAAAARATEGATSSCCCHCQQQQQQVQPLQRHQQQHWRLIHSELQQQQQLQLARLQFVCWDTPLGPRALIIPAPASPRLPVHDDVILDDVISSQPGLLDAGSSRGRSYWGAHRQVGPSRVEGAGLGAGVSAGLDAVGFTGGTGRDAQGGSSSSSRAGHQCSCGQHRGLEDAGVQACSGAGVQILQLPCSHEFCSGCIQTWLQEHISCPVCRWCFPEGDTRLINFNK